VKRGIDLTVLIGNNQDSERKVLPNKLSSLNTAIKA